MDRLIENIQKSLKYDIYNDEPETNSAQKSSNINIP